MGKNAKKYHRIKFFDRTKVERMLKGVLKALKNDPTNKDLLQQKRDRLDDLRYIKFFPREEKYISLFTKNQTEKVKAKQEECRSFALMLSTRSKRGKATQLMAFMHTKANAKLNEELLQAKQERENRRRIAKIRSLEPSKLWGSVLALREKQEANEG